MKTRKYLYLLAALLFLGALYPIKVLSSAHAPDLAETLRKETGGAARISYHAETGKVRFIGTDLDHAIPQPERLASDATFEVAALTFLGEYGSLFGLASPVDELRLMKSNELDGGHSMARFQQMYQGIPVVGGELIVNMDAAKNVLSANGEILPDIGVETQPKLDAAAAQAIALETVAKNYDLAVESLVASTPELWIFNPVLLGGPGPRITSLVWRLEVSAKELFPVRELVLVEANMGVVALHFNQVDTAKNRAIYDNNNDYTAGLPGTGPVCTEGNCPGSGNDYNFAYNFAGDTYDYYFNNHGRDSINGAGMQLISTVRYCPNSGECPYANAFWNGDQMVYGQGYSSADDVVAHEMTHGVTDYESHLFYYMQSGAINESLSDIWGEIIDQANSYDGPGGGALWLMGEDMSGGAIRSMENPTLYSDPDKMSSTYYRCTTDDGGSQDMGGVHTNSGVSNKAAYLMAAGASFNGHTVTALGNLKTAKIFYKVQTDLFTSGSDYQDLYDYLQQACTMLIGTAGITAGDCLEVKDAVDAVEMSQQPASCAANDAPVCSAGQTPNDIFFDNMENTGSGNWASAASQGTDYWYYPQNPNALSFDATYTTSGVFNIWGFAQGSPYGGASDTNIAMTLNTSLPPASTPYLHFAHAYAFETGSYDGGVLEYSTNGGGSWNDAGSLMTDNGYNGTISSGNPLGARSGFVNNSNGYVSTRLNLSTLAGQNVRFRFRMGTDGTVYDWGWFIDDVRIYTCSAAQTSTPTRTATATGPTPTRTQTPIGWGPKGNLPIVRKDIPPTVTKTPTATATSIPPTATSTATLPAGTGPTAGFWQEDGTYGCAGCSEFYVTTGSPMVDNFAIYISVTGCGNIKLTRTNPEYAINNNYFSFTGTYYANGSFGSQTVVSGQYGLSSHYIPGCGNVSGGPWSYQSVWKNSSQADPDFQQAYLVAPDIGLPQFVDPNIIVEFLGQ